MTTMGLHDNHFVLKARLPYFGLLPSKAHYMLEEISIHLKIKSELLYVEQEKPLPAFSQLRIKRLFSDSFPSKNEWGFYIPPSDSHVFFKEIRDGFCIVYGQDSKIFRYLLTVNDLEKETAVASIPLKNLLDINIVEPSLECPSL